jgi:hypothetical protein
MVMEFTISMKSLRDNVLSFNESVSVKKGVAKGH